MRVLLRPLGLAAAAMVVAVGLYAGLVALDVLSAEYGLRPVADSRPWAARALSFDPDATCARCHDTEAMRLASARHVEIGCQGCHGPLAEHATTATPTSAAVAVTVPTSSLCVRCHTTIAARPDFQPQITPANHYTDACLDCHDPHSGISQKPPTIPHPLERLPACITCHGPDGLKARTARHPAEPTEDAICVRCHAPGRGEIDVKETE